MLSEDLMFKTFLLVLKAMFSPALSVDLGRIVEENGVSGLVLDIAAGGSGTGPKVLGKDTVALDVSMEEVKEAIRNDAKAQWVCADARRMPFRDKAFNWAITFFGLMYIRGKDDKEKVLEEGLRVARKILLVEPIIAKHVGDYLIRVHVLNKGETVHRTCFGVSGKNIRQTGLIVKMMTSSGSLIRLEEERNYFIAILRG